MLVSANIFQPLIDVFQSIITFFHDSVGVPWGWSIVLLTVCVRVVLLPLTVKQYQSMRAMQLHAPELKAIQNKYKEDKQRQQQEMMAFYRENNVNPFASCLPMVLQLPVFISLFYMLERNLRTDICPAVQKAFQENYAATHHISVAAAAGHTTACSGVSDAGFLFINDITSQATGITLAILIVLYVGTQLSSTMLMAQPTMDKTQRRLMMFLPVVFVIFIIRFPAGLLVYWITTNMWTMIQQLIIRRRIGPPPVPAGAAGSDGPSSGMSDSIRRLLGGGDGGSRPSTPKKRPGKEPGSEAKETPGSTPSAPAERRPSGPPPSSRPRKKRSGRRR